MLLTIFRFITLIQLFHQVTNQEVWKFNGPTDRSLWTKDIKVSADCHHVTNDGISGILITLHTDKPFRGSIYSMSFQNSPCRADGDGKSKITNLLLIKKCGIERVTVDSSKAFIKDEVRRLWLSEGIIDVTSFGHKSTDRYLKEIPIYIQQDQLLQQASDVQYLIQCKEGSPRGLVTEMKTSHLVTQPKSSKQNIISHSVTLTSKTKSSLLVGSPAAAKQQSTTPRSTVATDETERSLINFRSTPATGWMEVVTDNENENHLITMPISNHLTVGENVSLLIKIRQLDGNSDTMLSSCSSMASSTATDSIIGEEGQAIYDLTDYRGCAVDWDILPNFSASFNSKTGVKLLNSSFQMFKFPDFDVVSIKCTILVCKSNCPVAKCSENVAGVNDDYQLFKNIKIIDKFDLDVTVRVLDDYDPPSSRSSAAATAAVSDVNTITANYHKSSQSVNENEFSPEKGKDDLVNNETVIDQDLLCMSPSRLIVAFGVLLVVLLLALLTACMLWLRARSSSRRPNPMNLKTNKIMPPVASPSRPHVVPTRQILLRPHHAPYVRVIQ